MMRTQVIPCVLALVVLVVAADLLLFQYHTAERLIANIAIVLVFGALYLRLVRPGIISSASE
jgi:uncharacterized membrane protein